MHVYLSKQDYVSVKILYIYIHYVYLICPLTDPLVPCYRGYASLSPLLCWLAEGSWVTGQRDTYRYMALCDGFVKGP